MAGAVFVVGGPSTAQQGPVAALVSTAGWARAAERVLGQAWIMTPDGVIDADEARARGSDPRLAANGSTGLRKAIPTPVKTFVKDVRQRRRARRFRATPLDDWRRDPPRFVWQRHELFQTAGLRLARTLAAPSVLFVPATLVWEAEQWGTSRPGWARLVERHGEQPALTAAHLVACGTSDVAEQVVRLGADPDRVIVTPTGVDLELFTRDVDRGAVRDRLGVSDRFVIGWVGSFRRFHAVERAVEAARSIDGACLLLVGDGPERGRIERMAHGLDVPVVAMGTVPHGDLVELMAAMDVAVVFARDDEAFHYSPLKVAEYLAAGVPLVAPAVGQLAGRLRSGVDSVLVDRDDDAALVAALCRVRDDEELARRLRSGARRSAEASWSWDRQVRRVLEAIDQLPAVPSSLWP